MPAILRDSVALDMPARTARSRPRPEETPEKPTGFSIGHTIGHAVESASGFELLHGEAVAVGIIAAEHIAQKLDLGTPERLRRIERLLSGLSAPLKIDRYLQKAALIDIIKRDKKAVNQWPRFVLLEAIGRVLCRDGQWAHEVDPRIVDEILDRLYA